MDLCPKTSERKQPGLLRRSALYARKKELLSNARMVGVPKASICLVAKKGVAFHNFLESTKICPHISEALLQVPPVQQPRRVFPRDAENGDSHSRQAVAPHSVCYMWIPWNPPRVLLTETQDQEMGVQ